MKRRSVTDLCTPCRLSNQLVWCGGHLPELGIDNGDNYTEVINSLNSAIGNINADLEVDVTPISGGNSGRIFYETINNELGEIPGFTYNSSNGTLSFSDANHGYGLIIGKLEVAPSIEVDVMGMLEGINPGEYVNGLIDNTNLGGSKRGIIGFQGNNTLTFRDNGEIGITATNDININATNDVGINANDVGINANDVGINAITFGINANDVGIYAINDVGINATNDININATNDVGINANDVGISCQQLAFYNAVPVSQQLLPLGSSADDIINALANLGLTRLT